MIPPGLRCDPFPEAYHPELYHPEPEREMALKALRHLIRYTHLIPWITGPRGIGKSVLLQRLKDQAPRQWHLLSLSLQQPSDETTLLQRLLHALEAPPHGEPLYALQQALDRLNEHDDTPVVLIDDAHHLTPEALRLLTVLTVGDDHLPPRLHAVLASDHPTPVQLEALRSLHDPAPIKILELPLLDREQTRAYLHHRIRHCGGDPESLLPDPVIDDLHRASQGLPAVLDRLARERLAQPKTNAPPPPNPQRRPPIRLPLWPLLLLPVAAILLWPQQRQPMPTPTTALIDRPLPLPRAGNASPAVQEPPPAPEPTTPDDPAPPEPTPPVTEETATAPTPPTETGAGTPLPPILATLRGPDWLLQRDPAHYTLQLISTPDPRALLDFAHRHRLEKQAAYYRFQRQGSPWYALVLGEHPDRSTAERARAALPPELRRQAPWIRPLRDIHRRIRRDRDR